MGSQQLSGVADKSEGSHTTGRKKRMPLWGLLHWRDQTPELKNTKKLSGLPDLKDQQWQEGQSHHWVRLSGDSRHGNGPAWETAKLASPSHQPPHHRAADALSPRMTCMDWSRCFTPTWRRTLKNWSCIVYVYLPWQNSDWNLKAIILMNLWV